MTTYRFSLFLKVSALLVSLAFATILSAQFAGGNGTEADPYQVATASHLNEVRNYYTSCFRQIADIDLNITPYNQGSGWRPIMGEEYSGQFLGKYNGSGYIISNLFINDTHGAKGLFYNIREAELDSISLVNVTISTSSGIGGLTGFCYDSIISNCYVSGQLISLGSGHGGLVGYCNNSIITNCQTSVYMTGLGSTGGLIGSNEDSEISYCSSEIHLLISAGTSSRGGLIGFNYGFSPVTHCYSSGEINTYTTDKVGGLIGTNISTAAISFCYSTTNVSGDNIIGGLIGYSDNSEVHDCYAMGSVNGNNDVGGLVGCGNVTMANCYSTGTVIGSTNAGGLIGTCLPELITTSYWDTDTSGMSFSYGGEGRTTMEMTYPYASDTYTGWDFETIWQRDYNHNINAGYPYLQGIEYTANEDDVIPVVPEIALSNYPNPFADNTSIRFDIPKSSRISLSIYNSKGQLVKTLADDNYSKGAHTLAWDGKSDNGQQVSNGIYLYRLQGTGFRISRKLLLTK